MTHHTAGQNGQADGFDRASALLRQYPTVDAAQLQELKAWFAKASSFEIASMASNQDIASGYALYKREHIDRFTAKDWFYTGIAIILLAVSVGFFMLIAP